MKISSGFFFRHNFSSLFIFIIESDENTDNREEHHRKKYRGGSYQNIERVMRIYILLVGGIKNRLKISLFYGEKVVHLADI